MDSVTACVIGTYVAMECMFCCMCFSPTGLRMNCRGKQGNPNIWSSLSLTGSLGNDLIRPEQLLALCLHG
jgi:hypothetical protein